MTVHTLAPRELATRVSSKKFALGFLTPHNPYDRRNFSGTPYFAAKALLARDTIETRVLGHAPVGPLERFFNRKTPKLDVGMLDIGGLDAVVGLVASPELEQLASLYPGLPTLHVTDATPAFLREAYGWQVPAQSDQLEAQLAARADLMVYSSDQIAARAARDLNHPGLAVETVPFGVNFDHLPETCPQKPSLERLNLLFVGVDWERKGGDIALETLAQLRAAGRDATLTIVGRCPEAHRNTPGVHYAGFLNKNRARDVARLTKLYRAAHLLLLPSRADCSPMVVAEALAHGTPVIATDTGGIASLLGGQGTGRLLPQFAPPKIWAETVRALTKDRDAYTLMSDTGFDRARTRLSWENWAGQIETLARNAVANRTTGRGLKVAAAE